MDDAAIVRAPPQARATVLVDSDPTPAAPQRPLLRFDETGTVRVSERPPAGTLLARADLPEPVGSAHRPATEPKSRFWPAIILPVAIQSDTLRSSSVEDYAKAIYALQTRDEGGPASTTSIAERLGVTPGSASGMVKRLGELGLVTHVPYRGVTLTEAGRRVALEVIRHHRLLELYLVQSLGLSWDKVHEEAEVLEHVLSEQLEERIAAQLGHPTRDPHGDPIPGPDLVLAEDATCALQTLAVGDTGTFTRVSDSDPEMLRYLAARGIAPGDALEVVDRQPFGGPLWVRFGDDVHALGGELAAAMRVARAGERR